MSYSSSLLLVVYAMCVFFFKQKTAYEMRISDWSSDVCSSDLTQGLIWVFLGKEPTYPVPVVPNCEEGKVLSRSFELVLKEPMLVEPWVFGTNTFDFAHFKSVHHFHMSDVNVVQKENQM